MIMIHVYICCTHETENKNKNADKMWNKSVISHQSTTEQTK